MSASAAILRKTCAFLRDVARNPVPLSNEVELRASTAAELEQKLSRKRSKKVVELHPRPAPAKMTTAQIRAACVTRAGGICECGCGSSLALRGETMDHWINGTGNRKKFESVETCWMLTLKCHLNFRQLHRVPEWATDFVGTGVEFWNWRFKIHCEKYGYPFRPHIVHQPLERRARP